MGRNRLAVNIFFFVNGFLYANWVSRIPRVQEIYALDNSTLGIMLLCISIGALVAMPLAGFLIARYGSHRITAICALLFISSIPLIPLATNLIMLGVIFFFMGSFTGMKDVAMNAQAVLVEKEYKRPIMSSFHAIFSAGMMIGAGTGALYTRFEIDLFPHLFSCVLLCVLPVLWGIRNLIPDEVVETEAGEGGLRMPSKALLGIGLIAFCCMLGEGAMADWTTNYLEKIVKASPSLAPIGLAAFSMAMMLGRFVGDRLRANWGDGKLLINSSLIALFGIGLSVGVLSPFAAITGFFLVGLGLATIVPIAFSVAGNMPGVKPGVGISMVTTIGYSGFLFGPPIIGFVADWQDLRIAMGLIAFLFIIMTLLSFNLRKRTERKLSPTTYQ
ncbi:MAG: MFS transporter [Saprospiraceae bacterium]|nr:MFS transporter [Saprospiraceae bacterium]